MQSDEHEARDYLLRQLDTAWKLMNFHLDGLTTEECLWRPAPIGLHVARQDGDWRADWPDREGYEVGPPSIAWLTWHVGFWWSMALDYSFGANTLRREDIQWPGSAESVRRWIVRPHNEWRLKLERCSDSDLSQKARTVWPFKDRPFGDVVAWANVELSKNAAEIGYVRFLYAATMSK